MFGIEHNALKFWNILYVYILDLESDVTAMGKYDLFLIIQKLHEHTWKSRYLRISLERQHVFINLCAN